MKKVCMCCNKVLKEGSVVDGKVSHGCCPDCALKHYGMVIPDYHQESK